MMGSWFARVLLLSFLSVAAGSAAWGEMANAKPWECVYIKCGSGLFLWLFEMDAGLPAKGGLEFFGSVARMLLGVCL